MDILQENIRDNRFLRLIEGALKAGYCEDWNFHPSLSGTPQGGTVTLPTILQTFFFRARSQGMLIDPEHHMYQVMRDLHPLYQGANQLPLAQPVSGL